MRKTEFLFPDTRHPSRSRSVYAAAVVWGSHNLTVSQRKKMFEPDRGGAGGKGGQKDLLLPLSGGQDQTDHPSEKFSGKRRHTTKERRGSSFRAKKLRQDASTSDVGNATHGSPQTRHKQQASVSSIVPLPLWNRLRNFGHHDLQSATMERFGSGKTGSGSDRWTRRKPTGASAAHSGAAPQEAGSVEALQNGLLAACPAFRNEIGGDADWAGSQTPSNDGSSLLLALRGSLSHDKQKRVGSRAKMILEGLIPTQEMLEHKAMDRQVQQILQPQSSIQFPFEFIDFGALYYRNHFYHHEHQNFFGTDEANGPIAISLRRERVSDDIASYFETSSTMSGSQPPQPKHQYRVLVRTSESETLRGTILEDSIPSGTKTSTNRGLPPRDVIEYISQGEFHVGCLKVGKQEKKVCQELMRLDEQELNNKYKVGILYCKKGQTNEEDMYNNETGSEALDDFLQTIGHRVTMKGFTKYRAQLDNKTDTTGECSIYTEHQGTEIMFHVSTYLPHTPSNKQQLLRKRHIGNDIVTVIFQEPDCTPFSPRVIRSQFQHIFVVVRVENPGTDYTKYRVAVTRSKDIPYFGPSIPEGGLFDRNEQFKEFFLTKLINACNASLKSAKFANMATRTRRQYLSDLCESSCTSLTIEQANNSGLVGLLSKNWGGKKREKPQLQGPLVYTPGAMVWNVAIILKDGKPLPFGEDHDSAIDSMMIVAPDLMAFVYTNTRDNVLHIPMQDVAGWIQDGKRINLFYDGSHCLSLEVYEQDDVRDITCRLLVLGPCLSASHEATLMEFQRGANGLLGFSINEVGEVHRVTGQAKQIGLQMKSRILQVEDRLVCTHKHSQITEILTDRRKTTVRAYVIPPVPATHRPPMYYPCLNWQEIWCTRPTHMNGDSEEQTQNGTEPMDTFESRGSVALREKRKATTIHSSRPNRTSYHEAVRIDEIGQLEQQQLDDDEPIYDRLRSTENQSSQANINRSPVLRARSPKPSRDNIGYTRVRGRVPGGRDHMPAQQIAENIRATERALSAGPSPEPLDHKLDVYTSHVPTHISNSSFLPNSQPHTTAPLSSLRRNSSHRNDKVMVEILDQKSPSSSSLGVCPPTPGSVHELAKKFSFSSPPQSNKSSPSRTAGSSLVSGAKPQTTPMKATISTSEMTRGGIPSPSRHLPHDVQMRGKPRSPKIRPASWDVSLIYNSEGGDRKSQKQPSEQDKSVEEKQFNRKENGRLPVRKRPSPLEDGSREETGEVEKEGEESEDPIVSLATGEHLSQEELRQISVRERTQHWEARGNDLPSFFTLPKSFRTKGGSGARPQSPQSLLSPGSGSRIPAPRSSNSPHTALTQSLKARNMYSKQSTPPIQEETDYSEDETGVGRNRLSEKEAESAREETAAHVGSGDVKMGSFVGGKVGVVSQMRGGNRGSGNRSLATASSQVPSQRERQMSPTRATSPPRRVVNSTRSPSPNSGSKIPTSSLRRPSEVPLRRKTSPPPKGNRHSQPPRGHSLDAVVLEAGMSSLHLSSDGNQFLTKENTNQKVEDWLRQSSAAMVTDDSPSSGRTESSVTRERRDQYRKNIHTRSMVKTAMI